MNTDEPRITRMGADGDETDEPRKARKGREMGNTAAASVNTSGLGAPTGAACEVCCSMVNFPG